MFMCVECLIGVQTRECVMSECVMSSTKLLVTNRSFQVTERKWQLVKTSCFTVLSCLACFYIFIYELLCFGQKKKYSPERKKKNRGNEDDQNHHPAKKNKPKKNMLSGHELEAMSARCKASDLGNLPMLWDRSIGPQINGLHVRSIRLTQRCWGPETGKQPV